MPFRRFLHFVVQRSRTMAWLMVCVGILSGLLSAGVLALINHVLHHPSDHSFPVMLGFVALVAGKLLSNLWSQLLLVRFSQDRILDLSLSLCAKIVRAPLRRSEQRGAANILVTLTDDVSWVTWAIQSFPQLIMNAAVVLGCGIYLAWLSWGIFLGVVGVTVVGALGYQWLHTSARSVISAAREARAELFQHFRSLTDGLKELLMHRGRRQEFVNEEVRVAAELYRQTNMEATRRQALAGTWTQVSFYSLIGFIVFLFPSMVEMPPEALTGYVVAILYMMGPIWNIIGAVPTLERGQVAIENIERLGVSLDVGHEDAQTIESASLHAGISPIVQWNDVVFSYDEEKGVDVPFTLGPISLELYPGELVFVIGGNGSGKSTFVKVLAGLYQPLQGDVTLAGTMIIDANREWYREHFSVVFSDFHLFKKLLGQSDSQIERLVPKYLRLLHMDQKVTVQERSFSTLDLSQGQRKRLALVTAYLEDRPIYVFDEWAADQDPQYKEIFYKTLLPDLRERGKLVIVITHDDRYFHLGNQVIRLEDGKVVEYLKAEVGGRRP
ncbi:MAG TPA: cyclic peptide export ABC transporter [Nitrospiraceae bacterium]|nr:cyclic peptide export ABC transporter [Nitrospiraceae bacterium]